MGDAKQRVINELYELSIKTSKLVLFMGTDNFMKLSKNMQYLMQDQLRCMIEYANILRRRLSIWDNSDEELDGPKCSCC